MNSPVNGSTGNPRCTTVLNVTAWDNSSCDTINVTFNYAFFNHAFGIWGAVFSNTVTVNSGEYATFTLPCLCTNSTYGWNVSVSDGVNTDYYPKSGLQWSDYDILGDSTYIWVFQTEIIDIPHVVINYPTSTTYSIANWQSNQDLNFTITSDYGAGMGYIIRIMDEWSNTVDTILSPSSSMSNGTYTLNLSDYVVFKNCMYNISVLVEDNVHCNLEANSSFVNFEVTSGTDHDFHFSVKNCVPENDNMHASAYIGQPFSFDACANKSGTLHLFICDHDMRVLARGERPFNYNLGNPLWFSYLTSSQYFQSQKTYYIYIGYRTSDFADGQVDIIYDDSCEYVSSFSYHFQGFDKTKSKISEDTAGDWDLSGVKIKFGTYPDWMTPPANEDTVDTSELGDTTGSTWGKSLNDQVEDATGIPYIGVVIAMLIIGVFSIIPIVATKTSPPVPVQAMFTSFGFVLSFAMGFLPLWVFVVFFLFILVFIFYKVWAWAKERGILQGVHDIGGRITEGYGEGFQKTYEKPTRFIVGKSKTAIGKRRRLWKDEGTRRMKR
jgi:hypothetical protein